LIQHPCALHGPASSSDPNAEAAGIASNSGASLVGGAIFEEFDLKAMRQVLNAVCERLHIHQESDDARRAALSIIRHAADGVADPAQLARVVEAELTPERETSDE
jgi:uncharacterized membrane protein